MSRIVDIESPYGASEEIVIRRNILYARIACSYALKQGVIPYASHLFFTQPGILNDADPKERELGIRAGKTLILLSGDESWFFMDLGESLGMAYGRHDAEISGRQTKDIWLFEQMSEDISYGDLLRKAAESGYINNYSHPGWI